MKVRTIGLAAHQVIGEQQEFRLLGASSRGIYLASAARVLFLSTEAYRGPLTLNLDGRPGEIREQPGEAVQVGPEWIWFPISRLRITTAGAEVWSPPPPAGDALSEVERQERFDAVARALDPCEAAVPAETAAQLARALEKNAAARLVDLLLPLLGRGPGLTPAGDDLILGLLLALSRWGKITRPDFPVEALSTGILPEAKKRTTTISADLIACAARGLADERLIAGLDGLAAGGLDTAACADCFRSWGHTSGQNAFLGMKLALGRFAT